MYMLLHLIRYLLLFFAPDWLIFFLIIDDEGPSLETLDLAFGILTVHTQTFYIPICISTLLTQHTTFVAPL